MNDSADYYYYELGVNPIPADTKNKTITIRWKEYQDKSIPDKVHKSRKKMGHYDKGIAIILGKVFRGKNIGQYLVGIDIDREKGVVEFLTKNNRSTTLKEFAEKTLVEQHKDELHKAHIYFYSPIPFPQKTPDSVLGIEVKSEGEHGLMFVSPSIHKNGYNYEIIGPSKEPLILSSENAIDLISHIDSVCRRYNIEYLQSEKNNKLLEPLRQIIDSLHIPEDFQYRIPEGVRHATLLSFANSLLIRKRNIMTKDDLRYFFKEVNEKLCLPSLSESELINNIWRAALKYSEKVIAKEDTIKIINNDPNDKENFNTQVLVYLERGTKLRESNIVKTFVYDVEANSVYCDLNQKTELKKNIIPINIKKWDYGRRFFQRILKDKGIDEKDIKDILEAFDNNFDLIRKHYLDNQRRHLETIAEAEERRKERLQLIREGTEFLIKKYRFLTLEESKDILYYDEKSGMYSYHGDIIIEKEIDTKYGYQLKTADITEIKNIITRKTYVKKEVFDSDLHIINMENGLYNWKTKELLPHTPDYFSLNQIPVKYNPNAKATKFEKFLNQVLYPQDIRTAKEIMAYTFLRRHLFQYYFVLIGFGANGKNVFLGILSHLHGMKNISNVSLQSLAKHRFALAQLENKNINIDTELSNRTIEDRSNLKKLTDNQPIMIERKGQDPYETVLWAKPFFSANQLPPTVDETDGHYRREIPLTFPKQFAEQEQKTIDGRILVYKADPELLNKIVNDEEEMSGIFNLLMNSLEIIDERKEISVKTTISERRAKAELIKDPVSAFVDKRCVASVPSSDIYTLKNELYQKFVEFCNTNTLQVPSYDSFSKDLRQKHRFTKDRKVIKEQKYTIWYINVFEDEKKKEDEGQEGNDGKTSSK